MHFAANIVAKNAKSLKTGFSRESVCAMTESGRGVVQSNSILFRHTQTKKQQRRKVCSQHGIMEVPTSGLILTIQVGSGWIMHGQ